MEASTTVRRGAARRRQPAYGEYLEHPEVEAAATLTDGDVRDGLGRLFQWPFLIGLALLETAWLVGIAYLTYRFVVSPIVG